MLDKILIVDFEDSFTYNIASVLFDFEESIKVVSHHVFFESLINELLQSQENKVAVIFGPGPGHPNDYQNHFNAIRRLRLRSNTYIMGICLGHQILGVIDGLMVNESSEQVHGQCAEININGQLRKMQRYNSLALYEENIELNVRFLTNGISYQFHPESVGTDSSITYFRELLDFLK